MLFTASRMPNPAECSVVLSLDESIRRHIDFLLKAAEQARGRIDSSSVGALHGCSSGRRRVLGALGVFFFFSFSEISPGGKRDIKAKTGDLDFG